MVKPTKLKWIVWADHPPAEQPGSDILVLHNRVILGTVTTMKYDEDNLLIYINDELWEDAEPPDSYCYIGAI